MAHSGPHNTPAMHYKWRSKSVKEH